MEATVSHMQTHGNVEVGRGQSLFEILAKPQTSKFLKWSYQK